LLVGTAYSLITPAGVVTPTLFESSRNQTLPSGPVAMSPGELCGVGTVNAVYAGEPGIGVVGALWVELPESIGPLSVGPLLGPITSGAGGDADFDAPQPVRVTASARASRAGALRRRRLRFTKITLEVGAGPAEHIWALPTRRTGTVGRQI
jgi:hypothetical protein